MFTYYDSSSDQLRASIDKARQLDIGQLPDKHQRALRESFGNAGNTFALVEQVRAAEAALAEYEVEYRPIHVQVRALQAEIRKLDREIEERQQDLTRESRSENPSETVMKDIEQQIMTLEAQKQTVQAGIPDDWEAARKRYVKLAKASKKASAVYRSNVDGAYEAVAKLRQESSQSRCSPRSTRETSRRRG